MYILKEKIKIYFRHVFLWRGTWKDINCKKLLNPSKGIVELSKKALRQGLRLYDTLYFGRAVYCEVDYFNHLAIGPDGNLYKCTMTLEPGDRVGYINPEGELHFDISKLSKWVNIDSFEDNECLSCQVLPICMGGCSRARVHTNGRGCAIEKDIVEEIQKLRYLEFKQETIQPTDLSSM